jgi:amino acid transporter
VTAPDPLKSFRGVVAAALALEGIVVLLALPLVAKLGEGLATWQGILVGALALALFLAIGAAGRPWAIWLALGLQLVMIACWFAVTALGVLGLIFGVVWTLLLWFRHDVAARLAQGRLPGQQQSTSD